MKHSTINRQTPNKRLRVLSAAFWFAVWALGAQAVGKELILPSPAEVLYTLRRLIFESEFWLSLGGSLLRVTEGFCAGVLLGALLSASTVMSNSLDALFSPVIRVIRSAPVSSFIILVLLWFKRASVPVIISAITTAPVIWSALVTAINETDAALLEMAFTYRFGFFKTLRLIYIPSVAPQFLSACLSAQGLAWKSGIAAEVICLPPMAAGAEIYYSKIYLETPSLFAWTAAVVITSLIMEKAFGMLVAVMTGKLLRTASNGLYEESV